MALKTSGLDAQISRALGSLSGLSDITLAFAFGLSAEIERNLISQRTKEALARRRAEGVILGHPKGRKSSRVKLTGREPDILRLLKRGHSKSRIARRLKVHRITLANFVRDQRLLDG